MMACWGHLCWKRQNGLLDMEIHRQLQGQMGRNLGRRGDPWQRSACAQRPQPT